MEKWDLTPKTGGKVFEGEGGAYYAWSTSDMPSLAKAKVGAGWLLLQPGGFALPHYADSKKLGYVLQGRDGVVGIVLPNTTQEVVLNLKKGDIIPIPQGAISWWFNPHHSQQPITIVFLGDTSNALIPGQFTYAFLAGALGIMGGFSSHLISNLYSLTPQETTTLTTSQTGLLIISLPKAHPIMPTPQVGPTKDYFVYNLNKDGDGDGDGDGGSSVRVLTEEEFPFIGGIGMSVERVRVEANAIRAPIIRHTIQLVYIVGGDGRVEIVGMSGKSELNGEVKAGHLVLVPQFYGVALIAGDQGMDTFSLLTTNKPGMWKLGGRGSIWEAISPAVQEVALNVDSQFEKLFLSKVKNTQDIIPPTN